MRLSPLLPGERTGGRRGRSEWRGESIVLGRGERGGRGGDTEGRVGRRGEGWEGGGGGGRGEVEGGGGWK